MSDWFEGQHPRGDQGRFKEKVAAEPSGVDLDAQWQSGLHRIASVAAARDSLALLNERLSVVQPLATLNVNALTDDETVELSTLIRQPHGQEDDPFNTVGDAMVRHGVVETGRDGDLLAVRLGDHSSFTVPARLGGAFASIGVGR